MTYVHSLVALERIALGEGQVALVTRVWPLASVNSTMAPQAELRGERLAAHVAFEVFLARVDECVDLQTLTRGEVFAASRTEVPGNKSQSKRFGGATVGIFLTFSLAFSPNANFDGFEAPFW